MTFHLNLYGCAEIRGAGVVTEQERKTKKKKKRERDKNLIEKGNIYKVRQKRERSLETIKGDTGFEIIQLPAGRGDPL